MRDVNREYLAARLKELSEWADYIHLSLSMDRPFERGKVGLLESLVPTVDLEQLRFDVRSVGYRLSNLSVNLSATAPKSADAAPPPLVAGGPAPLADPARVP